MNFVLNYNRNITVKREKKSVFLNELKFSVTDKRIFQTFLNVLNLKLIFHRFPKQSRTHMYILCLAKLSIDIFNITCTSQYFMRLKKT